MFRAYWGVYTILSCLCRNVVFVTWSVGPAALDHSGAGLPQDLEVQSERPVLHVPQVEPDGVLPAQVGSPVDLPEPGQPGRHDQPAVDVSAEPGGLGRS